jgi:hypothetical protein
MVETCQTARLLRLKRFWILFRVKGLRFKGLGFSEGIWPIQIGIGDHLF